MMSNLLIKNLPPNSIIKLFYTLYYLSRCFVLRLSFPNFIRQFMFNCFLTQVRSLSLLKNFVFCANFYLKLKKCKYIEICRKFCCIKTSSSAIFIDLVKYLNIIFRHTEIIDTSATWFSKFCCLKKVHKDKNV